MNKLQSDSREIVFEHFNKIFSTQNKSVIVTNSTFGVPSSWNLKLYKSSINFKRSETATLNPKKEPKNTKLFKKPELNQDEYLYAFQKYFVS